MILPKWETLPDSMKTEPVKKYYDILKKKNFKPYELKENNYKRLTKKDIKKISTLLDESCKKYYDEWKKHFKGFDYWVVPEEIEE